MLYFKHNGNRRGYTQAECALALGISTRTVRRMLFDGKLATIIVNRRRWISPVSVDHYLFEPDRLKQIIAEIDAVAAKIAATLKHPGRTDKMEESHA